MSSQSHSASGYYSYIFNFITLFIFTDENIEFLKNKVSAEVFGVPLPFVGVDGVSICDNVYTKAGDKASCPLIAGTDYTYKDSFPILSFYPNIQVKVQWSLATKDDKKIVCFEVPAKIVS